MRTTFPGLLICAIVQGCVIFKPEPQIETGATPGDDTGDTGTDTHTETDTDTDTDSDTDTDTDTDSDSDSDTDTDTGSHNGSDLVDCDDPVVDNTAFGTMNMDITQYEAWYCTWGSDYDGPERIYSFAHPGGDVTLTLDSPCGDLHMFSIRWEGWDTDDECPTEDYAILECDVQDDGDGGTLTVWQPTDGKHYLISVDGPEGDELPFALTVTCE